MAKKRKGIQEVDIPGTSGSQPTYDLRSPKTKHGQPFSFKKVLDNSKADAGELDFIISNAEREGHDFVYFPIETVKEWKDVTETRAEYTDKLIKKLGEEAGAAREYVLEMDLSAYAPINPFDQGHFVDWSDEAAAQHKDAIQKLGGNTAMLTWGLEMLPVYKTYRILKNLYDHATAKKEKKEPIRPVVTPEGGMVWDAESYWGFVRFLKENLTEQYIRTLDVVSKTENEDIAEREMKLFNDLGRFYVGLLGGSAIPFTANSQKQMEKYVETISKVDKNGKLPEYLETIGKGNKGTGASTAEKPTYTLDGNTLEYGGVPVRGEIPRLANGSIDKDAIANISKYKAVRR